MPVLAILDLLVTLALLVWWAFWSIRSLALQQKIVALLAQSVNTGREIAVDTRAVHRRLSE